MGIHGLKLGHKGSFGYLDDIQRAEVIEWLQSKDRWTLNELEHHIPVLSLSENICHF